MTENDQVLVHLGGYIKVFSEAYILWKSCYEELSKFLGKCLQ